MCGRFSFTDPRGSDWVRERFDVVEPPDRPPSRFNIAPTDPVLTVGTDERAERCAEVLRWDLFARRPPVINIRSETVLGRTGLRRLLERSHSRVLVLADGFYEWLHAEAPRQPKLPMRFHLPGQPAFAFAGVRTRAGCAIFTTSANELVRPVHDRMPVILDDHDEEAAWLDPRLDAAAAAAMLDRLPATRMHAERASRRVNDVRAEGPELWESDPPAPAIRLF